MKVTIIGSRNLNIDISEYIPDKTTEIISGGAKGIDSLAETYADENNILFQKTNPLYICRNKRLKLRIAVAKERLSFPKSYCFSGAH